MKTLVYSSAGFDRPFLEKAAHGKQELVFINESLNLDTVKQCKGFEAICLFRSDDASAPIMEKLFSFGVKYIALRTEEFGHVDLSKALALGIKVANVPECSPFATAEHAVALLLALNRKLVLGQKLMQIGDFRLDHLIGFDLHGKTVGIIGTGTTGAIFAKIMHGFGCSLLGFDFEENKIPITEIPISYVSLEDLCKKSDIISIHKMPKNNIKPLFNQAVFHMMKKGVYFINTTPGNGVSYTDLIAAIENQIIAAAGLDLYNKDLFFKEHTETQIHNTTFLKLFSHSNVLITENQGFLTQETLREIANTTIANLNTWEYNGISKNEILF